MKKLFKICSFFIATIFIILLASCNKNTFEVSCEARVTARRDMITVSASFVDSKERIFSSVTPYVSIYNLKDGKENEQVDTRSLTLKSGTDVSVNTSSNEVTFKNLEEYGTYIVKVLATNDSKNHTLFEETFTLNNLGTKENPIKLDSVESFLNNVPYDRTGYFELTKDIDFNNMNLNTMWSNSSEPFAGTLDGKGFKLSNGKLTATNLYSGLFGYNKGAISNLTLDNFVMDINRSSSLNAGLLCGYNKGNIENVTISNSKITGKDNTYSLKHNFNIGLLVGTITERSNSKIVNNQVLNSTLTLEVKLEANVGGLVGYVETPTESRDVPTIKNNMVKGVKLDITESVPTSIRETVEINVGGFVGKTGSILRNVNVLDTDLKLKTSISPKATATSGLKGYNVSLGGVVGKNLSTSNLKQVSFKGNLELSSELKYNKPASAEEVVDTVFNAYVGGIIGLDQASSKHEYLVSNVLSMKLNVLRENATGDVILNSGLLFGESNASKLAEQHIINYNELTPTISVSNDVTSNVSKLLNLSQDLTGFDEFITKNFA